MVLGYLVLGWIGGAVAAGIALATGGGALAAFGVFLLVGNAVLLASIGAVAVRSGACRVQERRPYRVSRES